MRVIEKVLRKREFLLMIFLAAVVMAGLVLLGKTELGGKIPDCVTHMGHEGEEQFIYYLTDADVVEQEFSSPKDFDMLSLHFSDHDQNIPGKSFFSVIEKESGKQIYYEEKANPNIHYGELVKLELSGRAERVYVLTIRFEGMGDKGLGIFGFQAAESEEGALVNGSRINYSVAIGSYTSTERFRVLVYFIFVMMVMILFTSVILVTVTGVKEEYLFLGIAVPVGIALLMFLSVNVVHDGVTHLAKVYHYSNVLLGKGGEDSYGCVSLKDDEAEVFAELFEENHTENDVLTMYWNTAEQFKDKSADGQRTLSDEYRETSASSIWEYFPGVMGMTLGRVIGVSPRFNILLAKMCFFAFYVGMVFWAIRLAPCFKTVIAFAGLLPMSLYQASGITYDSIVMALCLMITALFLKARVKALRRREGILLMALAAVLGCCKGGFYLLFLGLFALVPAESAGGRKRKWGIFGGSLAAGTFGMLVTSFNTYIFMLSRIFQKAEGTAGLGDSGVVSVNTFIEMIPEKHVAAYGIGYAFQNISGFVKMMIATLADNMEAYVGGLVGYRMAWSDGLINWLIIFAFLILLWLAASQNGEAAGERMAVRMPERLGFLLLFGIEVLGFHLLMLIETPVGSETINGVQGRYFLAWVPVVLLAAYSGRRSCDSEGRRRLFVYYSIAEVMYLYAFLKIFLGIL